MIGMARPARTWAALALMLAAVVPMADTAAQPNRCLEDFAPADEGTARPTPNAERTLVQARNFPGDRHLGRLRWATAHPAGDEVRLGPVKGGLVAVNLPSERGDGREWPVVRVMRASDGATVWERRGTTPPGAAGAPGILTLSSTDHVAAFDITTGRNLWCAQRSDRFPEALDNETVVTGHGDVLDIGTSITSLHARTGKPRWHIPAQLDTTATGAGVLAYDTNTAPAGLHVRRLPDATLLWRATGPIKKVIGVEAGRVLVEEGSNDYSWIVAYDLGTGQRRWWRPVTGLGMPGWRLLDDRLLVGDTFLSDSHVQALNLSHGSPLWSVDVPGGLDTEYAPRHRTSLYGPDPSGGLKVLDTKQGTVSRTLTDMVWPRPNFETDSVAFESNLTIGDGFLLAQIDNLTLAFDLPH
ncbi:PQQ-binding-like beta-propeller repeat protein [Actinomadura madurae]|uniref:outer membrane protein assembly factor BamB family protein n=1 Tax=Actinomadura madurae TaxID=1993 RepID=UPI000D949B62|nr:PQQ-binding-like beta-propeller repeat protein [Actinomadura madurae]SPT58162.1 Uncharacterised protein [Actinomadura madurae]